jgi:uracil-DNA glycosylase family 4
MLNDTYVPGHGPLGAKLVILGEAPSYEELEQKRPFVGPSGKELDRLLRDVGISRNDCWLTNVSKYFVQPNPPDKNISFVKRAELSGVNLDEQIDHLRNELNSIQPNCILALGGTALWALTGKTKIQDYRGSIMLGMGHKVVSTYHPAHLLHQGKGEVKGYWNRRVMLFDMARAKQQSLFKEIKLPSRLLQIARNSSDVYEYIRANKHNSRPAVDIEAHPNGSCIPICIGISFVSNHGITIPLWNVDGISSIPDADLASVWALVAELLYQEIVGQNFGYDRDKIKRLGFIIKRLASDTMFKAFCINPELPKNLAFNTSIWTEEPFYKNEGMYEGSIQDLMIGCARDSCVTKEIDLAMDSKLDSMGMRPYYENFMMPLHELYSYIEGEGLSTDESVRAELIKKYVTWDERIRYQLFGLAGDYINSSSPKQVASLIYGNWKIPQRKGVGEEVITALLNGPVKDPSKRKGLELILEDRRVKKTLSTYLLSPTDFDGRMRTSFFICLDTGRSSSNQQDAPIRPTLHVTEEGKKKNKSLGMAFQTITKHGDIGPEIRTMFIPDDGEIFLQADSSQAEARVVFLLAEDYEALELIDKIDYHALTTSWFFGGDENKWSKKVLGYECPERFTGKTLRHAGHLGMGKGRAAITVNTDCRKYKINYSVTEGQCDKWLKIFHSQQPKIKQVFHASVIKCLEKDRTLSAPVPYGIDAPKGGTRTFFERWNDELFRQAFSYIPQRTVSENIKAAALRLRQQYPWIRILSESHDALLTSVSISRKYEAATILRTELERPIDFSTCSIKREKLVIPCEVEEGMNWYDFKKVKFLLTEKEINV